MIIELSFFGKFFFYGKIRYEEWDDDNNVKRNIKCEIFSHSETEQFVYMENNVTEYIVIIEMVSLIYGWNVKRGDP